jgi:hypothetical protein
LGFSYRFIAGVRGDQSESAAGSGDFHLNGKQAGAGLSRVDFFIGAGCRF